MTNEVAETMILLSKVMPSARLTPVQLRLWLDRECPRGTWRDFLEQPDERDWYEFGCPFDETLPGATLKP